MDNFITEEQLENIRLKSKKLEKTVLVISLVSFLIYLYPFYISVMEYIAVIAKEGVSAVFEEGMSALFLIELIVIAAVLSLCTFILLWFVVVKRSYDKFNSAFKSKYVLQKISEIGGFDKLKYIPNGGLIWDEIRNAGIVACGDKYHYKSEDLLLGEYDNIKFKISDVSTNKSVRMQKRNRIEEIFSGQVICLYKFDDIKESKGHLQIFENKFMSNMIGWKADHKIQTENETFNSLFTVYADDEHNAYYILTPQRMEKIISFAKAVNGQISLVFQDEKLYVAVRRESMFEANIDEPVKNQTGKITEDGFFIKKAKEILVEQQTV